MNSNRLRSYVRRELIAKAREYSYPAKRRTPEGTRSACMDASRGTDTGWWSDLIYNDDVVALFNRYRGDAAVAIRDYLSETSASADQPMGRDGETIRYVDALAACANRVAAGDWRVADERGLHADAAMMAIRFAVEFMVGEVARDLCPDL
jgi:hypothetical protein